MADFHQFLIFFSRNALILGRQIYRDEWKGHWVGMGGGKDQNMEARQHE